MAKIPTRSIVHGVNDSYSRFAWALLALLCVYGAVNAVKGMKIELDDDHVGYKYLGMALLSLYMIFFVKAISSEPPSPGCRADRWVRSFVPSVLFPIIYFTIYNFQTVQASFLVLSIVFGIVALVQLECPVEGFHFPYVVVIIILGCFSAVFAFDYDPKMTPFWFCFLTLFLILVPIYGLNHPEGDLGFFSFY